MDVRAGLVLGLLLAAGLAGCGGADGGDGVATAGGKPKASSSAASRVSSEQEQGLKFARCMRDNGVPEFQDPKAGDGGEMQLTLPEGVDRQRVEAAQAKCKRYMPNGGVPRKTDPQVVERLRAYARCMRDNGVPKFPDPTEYGLQIDNNKLGVDPEGPVYKAAETRCANLRPAPPSGKASLGRNGKNG